MPKKNQSTSKPTGNAAMAAWVACGGVLIVLAFLFGTMVGDTGADAASSAATSGLQLPPGARQVSPNEVPSELRSQAMQTGPVTRAPVIITPQVIDLGTVPPNQTFPALAEIRNTSSEPVTIRSTRANCGCTTVDMAGTVIPPGRSVPLNASFNSQANIGPRSAAITVLFEGYDEPVQVNISANVQS